MKMGSSRPVTNPRRRTVRFAAFSVLAVVAGAGAALLLLPLAVQAFVRTLDLTLNACVWLAASISSGADGWTVLAAVGRAAGRLLLTTRAVSFVGGLILLGALALYGLQRLLGSEGEFMR
jgi:hypothetical protein